MIAHQPATLAARDGDASRSPGDFALTQIRLLLTVPWLQPRFFVPGSYPEIQ
jgi:hypothetical protein